MQGLTLITFLVSAKIASLKFLCRAGRPNTDQYIDSHFSGVKKTVSGGSGNDFNFQMTFTGKDVQHVDSTTLRKFREREG